jgi:hypothetical protein
VDECVPRTNRPMLWLSNSDADPTPFNGKVKDSFDT